MEAFLVLSIILNLITVVITVVTKVVIDRNKKEQCADTRTLSGVITIKDNGKLVYKHDYEDETEEGFNEIYSEVFLHMLTIKKDGAGLRIEITPS